MTAEIAVKGRPILFSGEMVRAILEDRKTQTRRVVRFEPLGPSPIIPKRNDGRFVVEHWANQERSMGNFGRCTEVMCPFGRPGNRMWVRETWVAKDIYDDDPPRILPSTPECACLHYLADGPKRDYHGKTRPGMFMPREFSRITLEITGVRVERLQEISAEDAQSEGISYEQAMEFADEGSPDYVLAFHELWESINGKRPGCAWSDNPWVWVVEFRRLAC